EVPRRKYSSPGRRTPRPHLQPRSRHPARNPGRKREEPGPPDPGLFCARIFAGKSGRRQPKPEVMIRIAIIGGGISGLTAAFTLEEHRRAGAVEYTLYESSANLGGVLRTERIQNCR